MVDIEAIEARAQAATPGPWGFEDGELYSEHDYMITIGCGISDEDAAHITGMHPQATLVLCAEVRRLREENARLRAALDDEGYSAQVRWEREQAAKEAPGE